MNDYKIKNILESLKEEVENGKVSLREAAVELHKAGEFHRHRRHEEPTEDPECNGERKCPGSFRHDGKIPRDESGAPGCPVHFPKRGIL